jgi:hypothetical protein
MQVPACSEIQNKKSPKEKYHGNQIPLQRWNFKEMKYHH